jgi:hypothetical protein
MAVELLGARPDVRFIHSIRVSLCLTFDVYSKVIKLRHRGSAGYEMEMERKY